MSFDRINGTDNEEAEAMLECLTRIATDLERALIVLWVSGGLLGMIAFLILLRTLMGR